MDGHVIVDKELGTLVLKVNARARRMVFRMKDGLLCVTVPPATTDAEVRKVVDKLRERLLCMYRKNLPPVIDFHYKLNADLFKLSLKSGTSPHFLLRTEGEETQIICPPQTDFAHEERQAWLRRVVEEAMRKQARVYLPPRLTCWARRYGLSFRSVRINSSHGHWGSCSAKKDITLSSYLLLLPLHLVDYVLLHELCHTLEMNHSERFWAHLNRLTEGHAKALRAELKSYRTSL